MRTSANLGSKLIGCALSNLACLIGLQVHWHGIKNPAIQTTLLIPTLARHYTMDPTSALSVAAAVVQLVDFGRSLLSGTLEIYNSASGLTNKSSDIAAIASDLSALSKEVEDRLSATQSTAATASLSEDIFVRLCGDCRAIADELQDAVSTVQAKINSSSKYARLTYSFLSVLREKWSTNDIESIHGRLKEVQQRITTAVLVFLW